MKQYNHLHRRIPGLSGILFLLFATACVSEGEPGEGQPLVVTAGIASTSTRAIDASNYDKQSFVAEDEIMISDGSKSAIYKNGSNGWRPSDTSKELLVTGTPTFTATYPAGFTTILPDQSVYEDFWKSNQLGATATPTGNVANFVFSPVAAKITVAINYTSSDGTATKYKNVTVSLSGTSIRTGSSDTETIAMLRLSPAADVSNASHSFVCILKAGTAGFTMTVSRTTDGDVTSKQTYTQSSYSFEAAKNYIYNFTSSGELILNGVTVKGFSDGGTSGDVSAT